MSSRRSAVTTTVESVSAGAGPFSAPTALNERAMVNGPMAENFNMRTALPGR
jgi:hypothetical protein